MAECYLQFGINETTFPGDVIPNILPMHFLIPDTHEHLFRFMDYDLYSLEEPLKEYLSILDGGIDAKNPLVLRTIFRSLREIHPFFSLCSENIQSFLNTTFADYIRHHYPKQDVALHREIFSRVAIKHFSMDKDPDEMFPEGEESSSDPDDGHRVLEGLFKLQDRIRRLVFITLDDTCESLASLPTARRTALYSLAYSPYSLAHISADFAIAPSDKMRAKIVDLDFEDLGPLEEEGKEGSEETEASDKSQKDQKTKKSAIEKLQSSLDELYWNPNVSISPAIREALLATTDVVDPTEITYDIVSFDNLLEFEVYRMITADTHIRRCTKCHKYFVPREKEQVLCAACSGAGQDTESADDKLTAVSSPATSATSAVSASSPAPKKPSSKKQKRTKTPLSKSPSYASYRTRYKTLSARVKAGTYSAGDLEKWRQMAVAKLQLVIDGKLDAVEYDDWLKE